MVGGRVEHQLRSRESCTLVPYVTTCQLSDDGFAVTPIKLGGMGSDCAMVTTAGF